MNEWIGLIAVHIATRPFFLIFLAGILMGVAVRITVPWPRWSAGPLVLRKRRSAVLPSVLVALLALLGCAMLPDPHEVLASWWSGLALTAASALLVWAALAVGRPLRAIVVVLYALPIVYGALLWAPIQRGEVRFARHRHESVRPVVAPAVEMPSGTAARTTWRPALP